VQAGFRSQAQYLWCQLGQVLFESLQQRPGRLELISFCQSVGVRKQ